MCIKESLRLFPPVIAVGRKMSRNVTFDGHVMPKGVSIKTKQIVQKVDQHNISNQFD